MEEKRRQGDRNLHANNRVTHFSWAWHKQRLIMVGNPSTRMSSLNSLNLFPELCFSIFTLLPAVTQDWLSHLHMLCMTTWKMVITCSLLPRQRFLSGCKNYILKYAWSKYKLRFSSRMSHVWVIKLLFWQTDWHEWSWLLLNAAVNISFQGNQAVICFQHYLLCLELD